MKNNAKFVVVATLSLIAAAFAIAFIGIFTR
jgi:hypothetical protein